LYRGAIIIDVRTANEFDLGHASEAINIPVDRIPINTQRIKEMKRPVVLCCKSGARSNQALQLLKAKGVKEVYNGGSWENVAKVLLKL
jgi:rhodanese-related sulfurtransferase